MLSALKTTRSLVTARTAAPLLTAARRRTLASAADWSTTLPAGQRHFLHVNDLTGAEFREVMDLAKKIKPIIKGKPGWSYKPFTDQTMAMIFVKASTRTRVSFETGWAPAGTASCSATRLASASRRQGHLARPRGLQRPVMARSSRTRTSSSSPSTQHSGRQWPDRPQPPVPDHGRRYDD